LLTPKDEARQGWVIRIGRADRDAVVRILSEAARKSTPAMRLALT
jgi:hypothetical protein